MAITKCKECGGQVSDQAATCPHCGISNPGQLATGETQAIPKPPSPTIPTTPPPSKSKNLGWKETVFGLAVGIGMILWLASSKEETPPTPAPAPIAPAAPPECASDDLKCRGDRGVFDAAVYCIRPIERLAKYSMRWTDSMLEMKFDRYKWKDKPGGNITYIGDRAEFQNGFGAYTRVTYVCTLAGDGKTVLDARVAEGLLK